MQATSLVSGQPALCNGRRHFLKRAGAAIASAGTGDALWAQTEGLPLSVGPEATAFSFGSGKLISLSDGRLSLPVSFVLPDSINADERNELLMRHSLGPDRLSPDCNVSLWRTRDHTILFDAGAGSGFMPSAGLLMESLAEIGIEPSDVTDVVFTHAHPDHLWGVIDDFDDLSFPAATYHMHRVEYTYWLAESTMDRTPDARKSFVAGAQNRLPRIEEQLSFFEWGDEILPGVEAVDTHGHTAGHTSFALHADGDSVLIVGDALTNTFISFERPAWPSGTDQDSDEGVRTRLALLDRLATEKTRILGFHLTSPGLGAVEHYAGAYRFVSSS